MRAMSALRRVPLAAGERCRRVPEVVEAEAGHADLGDRRFPHAPAELLRAWVGRLRSGRRDLRRPAAPTGRCTRASERATNDGMPNVRFPAAVFRRAERQLAVHLTEHVPRSCVAEMQRADFP
jgi:hypothetical protein